MSRINTDWRVKQLHCTPDEDNDKTYTCRLYGRNDDGMVEMDTVERVEAIETITGTEVETVHEDEEFHRFNGGYIKCHKKTMESGNNELRCTRD